MKKYLTKKTYSFIALFFVIVYITYLQKSSIIDELMQINETIKTKETDIKIAEKRLAVAKAKIEEIRRENTQNIKEKVNINEIQKKIKRQIKAYNLLNNTIKINFISLNEQTRYLEAFVAEFELISTGASQNELASALDFLSLYGVVESYKGNKAVVYVSLKDTIAANSVKKEDTPPPAQKLEPKPLSKKILKKDTIIVEPKKQLTKEIKKETIIKDVSNQPFKEKFLSANSNLYTINLFTSKSQEESFKLLRGQNLAKNGFTFSFGEKETLYKTMYGIYQSEQEAKEAIATLPPQIQKYSPRAEKIGIKQKLYKKYHETNKGTIQ